MSTRYPLLDVTEIDTVLEVYLKQIGEIAYRFPGHDSRCQAFQVVTDSQRWFIKHGDTPQTITWLKQASHFHAAVQHGALPQLRNAFTTPDGFTLVYDWIDGEELRPERELSADEIHPRDRFCALPAAEIIDALNVIYDVHILIEKKGFIAEDFYDGSIIYDFEKKQVHLLDFDQYHPGPFINDRGRLYGSSRFMAPEEFQKGERIDERTNVFMLGRTAFVLLANNSDSRDHWKGNDAMWCIARKATNADKQLRYQSVQAFVSAWHTAIASDKIPIA